MFQIYNEDCVEGMKCLADGSVDCIITDPPYCVGMTSNGIKGGYSDFTLLKPFFKECFGEWRRLLKAGGYLYVTTDWRTYPFLYPLLVEYFEVRNLIVWDKDWINAGAWYRFRHELIIFGTKGASERRFSRSEADIWKVRKVAPNDKRNHPSEKPVTLLEKMIADGTAAGETVMDSFMGSGSTGVAALNSGRNFIGFETEEKYYKVAEARLNASASVGKCDIRGEDISEG